MNRSWFLKSSIAIFLISTAACKSNKHIEARVNAVNQYQPEPGISEVVSNRNNDISFLYMSDSISLKTWEIARLTNDSLKFLEFRLRTKDGLIFDSYDFHKFIVANDVTTRSIVEEVTGKEVTRILFIDEGGLKIVSRYLVGTGITETVRKIRGLGFLDANGVEVRRLFPDFNYSPENLVEISLF